MESLGQGKNDRETKILARFPNMNWRRLRASAGVTALLLALPVLSAQAQTDQETRNETKESAEQTQEPEETQADPAQSGRRFVVTVEDRLPLIAEESSLASKFRLDLKETPASVSVVPRSLFSSQNAITVSEALVNVPGVNIQTGFGVHDLFFVRGFDSLSSSLILTDGAAEPEATFYNLYNVENVEVLRGPAAFLYGGNTISGTVNLTRKQPRFTPFWQAAGTVGMFETFRGQFDWNRGRADGSKAFRINAMGHRSGGYRNDRDNHQFAVNPAFTWRLDERSLLTANFEFVTNSYAPDAGVPVIGDQLPDVDRKNSYASPFDTSDQNLYRFRVDWESRLSDRTSLRSKFYYTSLNWDSQGTLLAGVFPNFQDDFTIVRVLNLLDNRQNLLGNQLEAIFDLRTGFLRHHFLAGVEVSRLGDDFELFVARLPFIDVFNPIETAEVPLELIPSQFRFGDTRSLVIAPYLLDRISLGERVHLFLGGRLDRIDFRDGITGDESTRNRFSPQLGALVEPLDNLAVYASAGRAFSPPSTLVAGDREPEESQQLELGVKMNFFQEKLQANVAAYVLEKDHIAIPDNGVLRRLGDQRSRGGEVELSWQATPFWHFFANYAYNDSELTRFAEQIFFPLPSVVDLSGNRAPFAPRHIVGFWTLKDFANGFGVGGGARYVSRQFIAPNNQFDIDSYSLFDAMLSYRFERFRVGIHLKNLSNREYEMRGFGANSVIPADPFSVAGTIEFVR